MAGKRKTVEYPRKCECGGTLRYTHEFRRAFVFCTKCTPVVIITVRQPPSQLQEHAR